MTEMCTWYTQSVNGHTGKVGLEFWVFKGGGGGGDNNDQNLNSLDPC